VEKHALSRTLLISMLNSAFLHLNSFAPVSSSGDLNQINAVIDSAESGDAAVAMIVEDNKEYDLIFMDIKLGGISAAVSLPSSVSPMMSGFEATNHIHNNEKSRNVPVVAVGSSSLLHHHSNDSSYKLYQEAGINELLTKPITISQLLNVLKKYVQSASIDNDELLLNPPLYSHPFVFSMEPQMLLNQEILDTLQDLDILEETVKSFEIQAHNLLAKARAIDPSSLQTRSIICQNIHALKGISLNSGASMLGKLCDDFERIVLTCHNDIITQRISIISNCLKQTVKGFEEI